MLSHNLELTQKQELRLSTQLLQTMETIGMSTEELREKIKKEAEENPVLEVREARPSYNAFAEGYVQATNRRESYSDSSYDDKEETNWIEGMISQKESLQEHLLAELGCLSMPYAVRKASETLITAMDRNGFLGSEPELKLPAEEREYFSEAIDIIRSLEPAGVGASDWRESLIIQAEEKGVRGEELSIFRRMVYEMLELLKTGKYEQMAKSLRCDTEEVEALADFLKTLTPYPGRKYASDFDEYIIPDISIKKDENGVLQMNLCRDALPSVSIDPSYRELADNLKDDKSESAKEARKYIKKQIASAESLLNQLDARASVLEKTGALLMEKQTDFFLYGPLYLKALTMQQAAQIIGVHDATISRIAASKYIDTDFGIWPIRSLFSTQVASSGDENYSKNAVKEMIRNIIAENDTGKPFSDQKISDLLAERGIKAARRTVSKYRKELDIESSFQRSK